MTELLEMMGPAGPWNPEWECPVDHDQEDYADEPEDIESVEKDEEAEAMARARKQDLHNSAKKLGNNLIDFGGEARVDSSTTGGTVHVPGFKPVSGEKQFDFTVAAHHLIPGNAALGASTILKFISQTKKRIQKNIGYNVNGEHNGIWLPGSYAVRASNDNTPVEDKTWSELPPIKPTFHPTYVRAIVKKAQGAQFHDTHGAYSNGVLKRLDTVAKLMEPKPKEYFCKKCEKKAKGKGGKLPPPYWLKGNLVHLSGWLKKRLKPIRKWELDQWATTELHLDTLKAMKAAN
jgi:A nuclease family of the HNH/ENDO VII superfamily with conserved AHH